MAGEDFNIKAEDLASGFKFMENEENSSGDNKPTGDIVGKVEKTPEEIAAEQAAVEAAKNSGEQEKSPEELAAEAAALEAEKNKEEKYSLSDIFGDKFKTIDEFKSAQVLERSNAYDELGRTVAELKEQNRVLSEKASILDEDSFSTAANFSKFAKETGINNLLIYDKLQNLDVKGIDYVKAIALADVIESPELISEIQGIEEDYRKKFKLGNYADIDPEDESKRIKDPSAELSLKKEGLKAVKKLTELKERLSTTVVEKRDVKKEREDYLADWNKVIPEIQKASVNIKIPPIKIAGEFDSAGKPTEIVIDNVNYAITESDKKVIGEMTAKYIESSNIPLTKENVVSVYQDIKNAFQVSKEQEIRTILATEVRKKTVLEFQKKYSNISLGKEKGSEIKDGKLKRFAPDAVTADEFVTEQTR